MFSPLATRLAALRARYAEPGRAYHGQRHIDILLRLHAEIQHHLAAPAAVETAIWYHDAIYVPLSADNEVESAALLRADLAGLADPALIEAASILVLATRDHTIPAGIPPHIAADCAWFLDLDLAILGADPATFAWYDNAIRTEYAAVPQDVWRARRPGVLQTFLARDRLYLTDHFHTRFAERARSNLRAAIAALAGPAP